MIWIIKMIQLLEKCGLAVLTLWVACLALSSGSVAHDLWLVPNPCRVGLGQPGQLNLVSGMKFPAPDLKEDAYTARDVARAVIRGPDRSRDLENPRVAGGGAKVSSFGVAPLPDRGPGARVTPGIRSYFTGSR